MGLKLVACAGAALVLAAVASASPLSRGAAYVKSQQNADGGFGEPGVRSSPSLTAWAVLGIRSARRWPRAGAARYLVRAPARGATDRALNILALDSLGRGVGIRARRLARLRAGNGRIGPTVNSTIWGVLALRAAGRPAGRASVRYLLRQQRPSGGWSWYPRGAPDSNDTAAAVQALRAAGVSARSRSIRRALRYLRRLQNGDGGFELTPGRGSDAQSTAWAIQAFVSARRAPGRASFAYLRRLQRRNGSFRYSRRYAPTPVWVTSQVLPALARRPFPLR